MKRLIIALGVSLVLAQQAKAWEFARNPDRFPSIGLNISAADLNGKRDEVSQPANPILAMNAGGDVDYQSNTVGADVRLPVNDGMTLTLSADHFDNRSTFERKGNLYRESESLRGVRYGLGVRIYFNK